MVCFSCAPLILPVSGTLELTKTIDVMASVSVGELLQLPEECSLTGETLLFSVAASANSGSLEVGVMILTCLCLTTCWMCHADTLHHSGALLQHATLGWH